MQDLASSEVLELPAGVPYILRSSAVLLKGTLKVSGKPYIEGRKGGPLFTHLSASRFANHGGSCRSCLATTSSSILLKCMRYNKACFSSLKELLKNLSVRHPAPAWYDCNLSIPKDLIYSSQPFGMLLWLFKHEFCSL